MPFDSSKEGEYLTAQWLSGFRPNFTPSLLRRLREGFQQQIIAPPLPLHFPIPFPQSTLPGGIIDTRDDFNDYDFPIDERPPDDASSSTSAPSSSSGGGSSSAAASSSSSAAASSSSGGSGGSGASSSGGPSVSSGGSAGSASGSLNPDAGCGTGPDDTSTSYGALNCAQVWGGIFGYQRCNGSDNYGSISDGDWDALCPDTVPGAELCTCFTNCDRCDDTDSGFQTCCDRGDCGLIGDDYNGSSTGHVVCCYDDGTIRNWFFGASCCACQ